jgi:hypothetical protein
MRAVNVSPMIELDRIRIEMAMNVRVSKAQLRSMGIEMYLASVALIHLFVVPMCVALAATGTMKESPNSETQRKVKITETILSS